ncbi:bifunctional diaminohydroxyphosphoribosylaminopyrimidine deaminase/5-amino-6-(5-phosphoribosylamino)uracil reductase RibD [bacterium]|nr:bifunctional diaminohydroxyphosphoribosylaminopyrimidine deaminase/5-amino-6-(5-phosphoribosylamino)uracil reductase RibD [bacterium]MBU1884677.1 bifunctional diaminohydroxyphosphoribosylaminopyrimidine deaminase/5-amino-6-(5-phosphoribosylamino)uracil reductase RibD [bacterium]
MVIDDNFFMDLALAEAWGSQILTYPNPAVGCAVVNNDNELLAVEAHKKSGGPHAEVLALQSAYFKLTNDKKILSLTSSYEIHEYLLKNHNGCFKNCTLHVTLEPCGHEGKTPSCANLISHLGVKRVVIATADESQKAKGGQEIVAASGAKVEFSSLHVRGDALLAPFLKWSDGRFVFFKWAQRLDGTIDGGTISSQESRTLVHKMRDVCDLIVVGGETVRCDRPTLDARLCEGKAPDVLIVSRSKEFDKTIPLFHVPNRKVMIEENFDKLADYRCILIEGGSNMFKLSKNHVDYYLSFVSAKSGGKIRFNNEDDNFELLHVDKISDDILLWMKLK